MTTQTFSLFVALLTLGSLAGIAALVAIRLVGGPASGLTEAIEPVRLPLAWAVAAVATLGSLYLSEVAHFIPCNMCWYQRIAMYPIGPMLLFAWFRRDASIKPYVMLVAVGGALVSTYHVLLEIFPSLESSTTCGLVASCSTRWVEPLGIYTIPRMALSGFVAIIAALTLVRTPPVSSPETALH